MKETEDQRIGGTLVKDLTGKVCEGLTDGAFRGCRLNRSVGKETYHLLWKSKDVPRTKEVGTVTTTTPKKISMVFMVKYHNTKGRN